MQRFIGLTGTVNFRDMGGYPVEGGRWVRWRTLYRSGTVHCLTAEDRAILATIPIRTVFDLRSNTERQDYPHAFSMVAEVEYHKRDHETLVGNISGVLREPGLKSGYTDGRDPAWLSRTSI